MEDNQQLYFVISPHLDSVSGGVLRAYQDGWTRDQGIVVFIISTTDVSVKPCKNKNHQIDFETNKQTITSARSWCNVRAIFGSVYYNPSPSKSSFMIWMVDEEMD